MTSAVEEKQTTPEEGQEMIPIKESDYGCQILLEKTTIEKANDKSFPTDAKLIWYIVDGVTCIDLTRCGKDSRLFDMYYDKYKKDLVNITQAEGRISPKLWNPPGAKKEKK